MGEVEHAKDTGDHCHNFASGCLRVELQRRKEELFVEQFLFTGAHPPSFSAPSRSFSAPSRSFSAPSRSFSAPPAHQCTLRSFSAPSRSFSAPSRSFSAPPTADFNSFGKQPLPGRQTSSVSKYYSGNKSTPVTTVTGKHLANAQFKAVTGKGLVRPVVFRER